MTSYKTVIDSIIEEIRNGMLLRKPIIYLETSQIEIVRRVLNSDRIIVRMTTAAPDEMVPYASRYGSQSFFHDVLVDTRIKNIKCDTLKSDKNFTIDKASDAEGKIYGIFSFANVVSGHENTQKATEYLQPSALVLSVHTPINANQVDNSACFDKLFPFIDRYTQETDDNSAIRSSLVLLYGEDVKLPTWILPYCYIVKEPYPQKEEILGIIERKLQAFEISSIDKATLEEYALSLLGNSLIDVETTVEYLLNSTKDCKPVIKNKPEVKKILATLKEQNVRRVGFLDLMKTDSEEKLGGMDRFKNWLDRNKKSILESERLWREKGADRQKGILMCGIPGCGKSAAVNILGTELKLPVLKMDIGKLMGSYVGDSEHNMYKALQLAEAMSPCILYIDEIEKGFSGSDSGDSSGVTRRMFGILLTWMQECKKPVYIFATANSLTGLPKEFFRSGRFDALFALYMPTYEECIDIIKKRMEKAEAIVEKQNDTKLFMDECYNDENLVGFMNHLVSNAQHRFVTGADITKLVNIALRQFAETKDIISHTSWIQALKNAADETIVYGDGEENLVSIAACYTQMMRLGFTPTSGEDNTLFEPKDYRIEYDEDKIQVSLEEKNNIAQAYDKELYDVIREKITIFGKHLEDSALKKLIR